MSDEPIITLSAAAKAVGVNKSTLSRQIRAGLIRSHDGGVRLSEVIADRKSRVAWQPGAQKRATTRNAEIRCSGAGVEASAANQDDDAPIGPRPFITITERPLTRGMVRDLAEVAGSEYPNDMAWVAYDLVCIGISIAEQEIQRLKALAGESDPPSNGA